MKSCRAFFSHRAVFSVFSFLIILALTGCAAELNEGAKSPRLSVTPKFSIREARLHYTNVSSRYQESALQSRLLPAITEYNGTYDLAWEMGYYPAYYEGEALLVPLKDSALLTQDWIDAHMLFFRDSLDVLHNRLMVFVLDSSYYVTSGKKPDVNNFTGINFQIDNAGAAGVFCEFTNGVLGSFSDTIPASYSGFLAPPDLDSRKKDPKCYHFGNSWWDNIWGGVGGFFKSLRDFFGGLFVGNSGAFGDSGGFAGFGIGFGSAGSTFGIGGGGGSEGGSGGSGNGTINLSDYFSELQIKQFYQVAKHLNDMFGLDLDALQVATTIPLECVFEYVKGINGPPQPEIPGEACVFEAIQELIYLANIDYSEQLSILNPGYLWLKTHPNEYQSLSTHLLSNLSKNDIKSYHKLIINMIIADSQFKLPRFIELYGLIKANPNALIQACAEANTNYPLSFWATLAGFIPPKNVKDKISSLGEGWRIQYFNTPTLAPSINLDYFPVTITQLPIKNSQTGERWKAGDLFQYIRRHINSFINTNYSEFTFTGSEDAIWQSSNPTTAVCNIEIPLDDGSVICSESQTWGWVFSTLKAPYFTTCADGYHPVSGNREFGYHSNIDGSFTLFTKGADRYFSQGQPNPIDNVISYALERLAFDGADALWSSFQDGVESYVNSNGGHATKNTAIKNRPLAKTALKTLLKSNSTITNSVLCGN